MGSVEPGLRVQASQSLALAATLVENPGRGSAAILSHVSALKPAASRSLARNCHAMGMVGDYQLEVLTRDGTTPLAQVHHDGRTYVVAEPGAAYKLRLTGSFKRQEGGITVVRQAGAAVHSSGHCRRAPRLRASPRCPGVQVRAYIDGKSTCPGFYKHGSSYPSQVLFPGWLASATATSRVFRQASGQRA